MEKGSFREDLYDRLNGFSIEIPPLRERQKDIPALVDHFIQKYNRKYNESVSGFAREAMARLTSYPWNGNARELENMVSRAVILFRGKRRVGLNEIPDNLYKAEARAPLNTRQETILSIIREKGRITVKSITPQMGISDRSIRNHL